MDQGGGGSVVLPSHSWVPSFKKPWNVIGELPWKYADFSDNYV